MSEFTLTRPLAAAIFNALVRILSPRLGEVTTAISDIGGATDQFTTRAFEVWSAELNDHPDVTPEQIASDAKLYAAFTVANTILRSQTQERIKLFARLHANFVRGIVVGSDDFKEFVGLLDDLSERELEILLILDELGKKPSSFFYATVRSGGEGGADADRGGGSSDPAVSDAKRLIHSQDFWNAFREEAARRFRLSVPEIANVVQRLARTGLCQVLSDSSGVVVAAATTPYFRRFLAALVKYDKDGQPLEKTISIKPLV
jgi:hypothetical protein